MKKDYIVATPMPDQSTQTESDPLYQEALRIVNNFEIIEKYWQQTEIINYFLLTSTLIFGATSALLWRCLNKHG